MLDQDQVRSTELTNKLHELSEQVERLGRLVETENRRREADRRDDRDREAAETAWMKDDVQPHPDGPHKDRYGARRPYRGAVAGHATTASASSLDMSRLRYVEPVSAAASLHSRVAHDPAYGGDSSPRPEVAAQTRQQRRDVPRKRKGPGPALGA